MDDSLASKFTVSPTLISVWSALILALGAELPIPEHPAKEVVRIITIIAIVEFVVPVTVLLHGLPLIWLLGGSTPSA